MLSFPEIYVYPRTGPWHHVEVVPFRAKQRRKQEGGLATASSTAALRGEFFSPLSRQRHTHTRAHRRSVSVSHLSNCLRNAAFSLPYLPPSPRISLYRGVDVAGMQSSSTTVCGADRLRRAQDQGLPPVLVEKQAKVKNFSRSTAAALTGQLENCVHLLRGHCTTLQYCNAEIEGALLTLGVDSTHSLLAAINGVVEGLETVAETCKEMCESHFEEVRQREDLFASCCNMYLTLKERHEVTERELRSFVAERDRQNAAFDKAVAYVETLIAERARWQERNGYNCVGLPLVEKSFSEQCHEALDMFDRIAQETRGRERAGPECLLSTTDAPDTLVKRWEMLEDLRHVNGVRSARLQYVPPGDEVALLREVLEMGSGSRALLHDVREERRGLEEAKKKVCEIGVASLAALQLARAELNSFKGWLVGLEKSGLPFNTSFEKFRTMMAASAAPPGSGQQP
ncbi:uncharacterized protein Tco025E_06719 [Trypanosoma conorhini]|uniref:Uncharacterized protein n=1 Tax=Trypanosoma conorhini TaxID=83891 RepID=A0A3R7KW26_9TRYP|nr:uncharacterized protein Tco025E_06719 [Trypanosoma conorhini]RNF10844.1 hypothetical protein Tco025E_06719 [Trypanosoma conorhini]